MIGQSADGSPSRRDLGVLAWHCLGCRIQGLGFAAMQIRLNGTASYNDRKDRHLDPKPKILALNPKPERIGGVVPSCKTGVHGFLGCFGCSAWLWGHAALGLQESEEIL